MGTPAGHGFGQALLMRNAAEHVLMQKSRRRVEKPRRGPAILERPRHLPVNVAVHAVDEFRPERGLGNVGVDIDDEIIVGARFLRGVCENVPRVSLDRDLRQFADTRRFFSVWMSVFAVPAVARCLLQHRLPPLTERARGRASAFARQPSRASASRRHEGRLRLTLPARRATKHLNLRAFLQFGTDRSGARSAHETAAIRLRLPDNDCRCRCAPRVA